MESNVAGTGLFRWVKIFSVAVILYGIYNLAGAADYDGFTSMFKSLPALVVMMLYGFVVAYGVSGVYCGMRLTKLEDWARKVIVFMTSVSIIMGFLLNRMVMDSLRDVLLTDRTQLQIKGLDASYSSLVALVIVTTVLEISIVVFFTFPKVKRLFSHAE